MIITRIIGGLGNQMFQYAAGRALADRTGQQLKLDVSGMDKYTLRQFALNQFSIDAPLATRREIPRVPKPGFKEKLRSLLPQSKCVRVTEDGLAFNAGFPDLEGPIHLSGYWQSEKYFVDISDVIRREFTLKNGFSPVRHGTIERIKASIAPVSLHVRRGDYVTNLAANAIHGTCEPEWYRTTMERMASRIQDPEFFVFSDDPQWCRSNLPKIGNMVFVEPQADGRDGEDMHLMASCRAHITANSSFSWWGAWLNPRADKYVIAPKAWFRAADKDDRDIVPEDWDRV